jgi:DNA-binding NarL/FixJ family response regulator
MKIGLYSECDLFAKGLQCLLRTNLHFEKVVRFDNPQELTQDIENGSIYNLLILDIDNITFDGLAVVRHLVLEQPTLKILVISSNIEDALVGMYRMNKVKGIVHKNASFEELHQAVDDCLDGDGFFPKGRSFNFRKFFNNFFMKLREDYQLSDREMEIMQLIFSQYATNEIAEKLNLSPHTIRTHRKNIFKKLKIHSLSGLLHLMP